MRCCRRIAYGSVEEVWWHEFVNKLAERQPFNVPERLESTQLKAKFLFQTFAAFCVPVVRG